MVKHSDGNFLLIKRKNVIRTAFLSDSKMQELSNT